VTETVLASWKDGAAKQAILDFVTAATTPGPAFVEPADRIATFDNDGTLWVEQPLRKTKSNCGGSAPAAGAHEPA
jgi:hypothetical protein